MKDILKKGKGWTKGEYCLERGGFFTLTQKFIKETQDQNNFQSLWIFNNLLIDFEITTYLKNGFIVFQEFYNRI